GADDGGALGGRTERGRYELAGGGEDDRRVELLRPRCERVAGPFRTQLEGERLRLLVARPREGEDAAALVAGDLGHNVGGRPEAVESQPLAVPGQPQRPVPDQPGAQEWRCPEILELVRD